MMSLHSPLLSAPFINKCTLEIELSGPVFPGPELVPLCRRDGRETRDGSGFSLFDLSVSMPFLSLHLHTPALLNLEEQACLAPAHLLGVVQGKTSQEPSGESSKFGKCDSLQNLETQQGDSSCGEILMAKA